MALGYSPAARIRTRNPTVGTGVLDGPRKKNACFLYGYWYIAVSKATILCFWPVEDAGPYKTCGNFREIAQPYRFAFQKGAFSYILNEPAPKVIYSSAGNTAEGCTN